MQSKLNKLVNMFCSILIQKDRAIKKYKSSPKSPRMFLFQFLNAKPFSEHRFGAAFKLKVDQF